MQIDARSIADGTTLSCDLCVVGAGPAGISLVDRLRESGLSICLLESGSFEPELATQRLNAGTTTGHRYWPSQQPLPALRWRQQPLGRMVPPARPAGLRAPRVGTRQRLADRLG